MLVQIRWWARRAGGKLLVTALALVLAACSSGSGGGGSAGGGGGGATSTEPVTLQMSLFGDFGYDPLIAQWKSMHPNVTIKTTIAEYNAHHDGLTTALAAGSGAPDIAAVEVGFISKFKANPANFLNLLQQGAGKLESNYLPWKWHQALTGDRKALIGLPTDVGGMAMAYRRDLFEKAGLPSDRDEVSALWPTWADFIEVGKQYTLATKKGFIDEGSQLYNAVVNQGTEKYYTPDDKLIYSTNPQVRAAWDTTCQAIDAGIVANIEPFAEGWNAAMTNGDFAVLTAPAWMMGYIQGQAPKTEGNWDIAKLPGGGGNWGGSFLAITSQSKHPKEAYDFISWLLAPEQQLQVFRKTGNFPSTPDLYSTTDIKSFANPFFHNAPVGEIYAENALAVVPIYEGPDEGAIRLALEQGLDRIEDGREGCQQAWQSSLAEIQREVG